MRIYQKEQRGKGGSLSKKKIIDLPGSWEALNAKVVSAFWVELLDTIASETGKSWDWIAAGLLENESGAVLLHARRAWAQELTERLETLWTLSITPKSSYKESQISPFYGKDQNPNVSTGYLSMP